MKLVLDVYKQHADSVKVTTGQLSKREFKRRCKSGYYMVPEGQTMADQMAKARSDRISKMFREIYDNLGK